ncbi:MAG: methyltransferase domain-containing protein [Chloroflexi bacterium]|nr:methyltransferase domain-containing protein [Chloroflexota bacterium]
MPPLFEAEIVEGIEALAENELRQMREVQIVSRGRGAVQFTYAGNLRRLQALKLTQAIYAVQPFAVPRPKALLGDQHFRAIMTQVDAVLVAWPRNTFKTIHIAAAGAESGVMQRLLADLVRQTGLQPNLEEGDLLLRIRSKSQEPRVKRQELRIQNTDVKVTGKRLDSALSTQHSTLNAQRSTLNFPAWEVLTRLTPRPLATRAWRVCNYEGALNATVAQAMALLTQPKPSDVILNLLCGSGSLLIERGLWGEAAQMMGCDINQLARDCAEQNIKAAAFAKALQVMDWDARQLPLPDQSVDVLLADLPFGNLLGSHRDNLNLYPAVLREAARVAKPNARFVLITHEIKLIEAVLTDLSGLWQVKESLKVTLRGLHPRIYILNR